MHLKCPEHREQPIDLICLSSGCEKRGVHCYLCKLEHHQDHDPIIPLKPFINSFLQSKNPSHDYIREVAQIDKQFVLIQDKLSQAKRKCLNYGIIEESFVNFRKTTVKEINNFEEIIKQLINIVNSKDPEIINSINLWIEKHSGLHQIHKQAGEKDQIYGIFLERQIEKLKGINEAIQKTTSKSHFQDSQLLLLFEIEKTNLHRLRLKFSDDLKGTCMTIHTPTKASMTTSGSQRMILLEPALNTTRSIKRWKVKIEKLASWIGVGVSHLDSVRDAKFEFSYTSAGHGNYLVSSNGYSWNGYKMEFNSKHETFQYKTGDTIDVSYDPVHNKITFSKEGEQKTFTYQVDPNQKPIHASINMTGVGDCVEILL